MLAKINKITNRQAATIIAVVGFAVYFTGLNNPFLGDDFSQIVNNIPAHSITNIRLFFEGGTFYYGKGLTPLSGVGYRPLMTTGYSIIYSLFGPHPLYFHILQLLLHISSAILLYMFFMYSFKKPLALTLSLIFLVHPIDSQAVFAVATLQDALFFFFGILALYVLLRSTSIRSLFLVALCLLLSLFSKETGILFIMVALLYLCWWNRKRLLAFIAIMMIPLALYLTLRLRAVGIDHNPNNTPIDNLGLAGRILTAPSILLFYITKFLFPIKLASAYYWVYPTFSIRHFLVPLIIDLAVIAAVLYVGVLIKRHATKAQFCTYLFFTFWAAIGLLAHLQIEPLDFTANETWFYFPMAGVLGMIGMAVSTLAPLMRHIDKRIIIAFVIALIMLLSLRTAIRGTNWNSTDNLARHDIAASSEDFNAYYYLGAGFIQQGNYSEAKPYILRSIAIYPSFKNYFAFALLLSNQGEYASAVKAYNKGLENDSYLAVQTYENLSELMLVYGSPHTDSQILEKAVELYPHDSTIWLYIAIYDEKYNDNPNAKIAISNAAKYGQVSPVIYANIMENKSFVVKLPNLNGVLKL